VDPWELTNKSRINWGCSGNTSIRFFDCASLPIAWASENYDGARSRRLIRQSDGRVGTFGNLARGQQLGQNATFANKQRGGKRPGGEHPHRVVCVLDGEGDALPIF
jgi:hypothetical protein